EAHNYQTKKPNSKTQYTTSTDQHKSTKKRVSTKPKIVYLSNTKLDTLEYFYEKNGFSCIM
ncbi:hypothetical protein, partial [Methanobacterium sp. MZD130B]|uniref:hypothetical protein n=1 Tax=Methanobacterium sp. MZD130B TaxID=3394378 RepID=UPI0039FB91D9